MATVVFTVILTLSFYPLVPKLYRAGYGIGYRATRRLLRALDL